MSLGWHTDMFLRALSVLDNVEGAHATTGAKNRAKLKVVSDRLADNLEKLSFHANGDMHADFTRELLRSVFGVSRGVANFPKGLSAADQEILLSQLFISWQLTTALLLETKTVGADVATR